MKQVRMKDIALKLGISTATVSRVLREVEDPYISEATKKKVRETALHMGYRKNIIAQALTGGKTNLIEVQIPFYYITLNTELLKCAAEGDYQLVFRDMEAMYIYQNKFVANNFISDGIISMAHGELLEQTTAPNTPCVSIGHCCSRKFDHVFYDFYGGTKKAVEHLLKTCKRPAYLCDSLTDIETESRCRAYADAMREAGQEPYFLTPPCYEKFTTYRFLKEKFEKGLDFDGVFCHSGDRALAVYRFAYEKGLKIPEDLSVIGVGEINDEQSMMCPSISCIAADMCSVAKTAWEFLHARIEHPDMSLQEKNINFDLIFRESTKTV